MERSTLMGTDLVDLEAFGLPSDFSFTDDDSALVFFALYDEDLKPGPTSERSFEIFKPDLTMTYDAGLSKSTVEAPSMTPKESPDTPTQSPVTQPMSPVTPPTSPVVVAAPTPTSTTTVTNSTGGNESKKKVASSSGYGLKPELWSCVFIFMLSVFCAVFMI